LWDRLTSTDDYTEWWPWLKGFDAAAGFVRGAEWTCEVDPPLPYTVRFRVHLERVEPAHLVHTTISGDIAGTATLAVTDDGDGSHARLVSELRPTSRLLRGYAVVARPLVEFGHNWVLDRGRSQFVEGALSDLDRA
jgi:hypothetical protein